MVWEHLCLYRSPFMKKELEQKDVVEGFAYLKEILEDHINFETKYKSKLILIMAEKLEQTGYPQKRLLKNLLKNLLAVYPNNTYDDLFRKDSRNQLELPHKKRQMRLVLKINWHQQGLVLIPYLKNQNNN
jgi:hypothetical protein